MYPIIFQYWLWFKYIFSLFTILVYFHNIFLDNHGCLSHFPWRDDDSIGRLFGSDLCNIRDINSAKKTFVHRPSMTSLFYWFPNFHWARHYWFKTWHVCISIQNLMPLFHCKLFVIYLNINIFIFSTYPNFHPNLFSLMWLKE